MVSGTNCSSPPSPTSFEQVAARRPVLRDAERHGGRPRTGHRADAGGDDRGRLRLGRHEVGLHDEPATEALVVAHAVRLDLDRVGRGVDEQRRRRRPAPRSTWLAKPSSAWSGWTWLQIQLSVPGLAFSAISHGAVGTMTPLGQPGVDHGRRILRRVAAGPGRHAPAFGACCSARVAGGDPGGTERGELQELAAVDGAASWERRAGRSRRPGGGAAREQVYPSHPRTPPMQAGRVGRGGAPTHSGVTWARSLPGPLRRALSRLVHAAWEAAASSGPSVRTTPGGGASGGWAGARAFSSPRAPSTTSTSSTSGPRRSSDRTPPLRRGWRRARRCRPTRSSPSAAVASSAVGSHIVGHWEIVIGDDIQTGPYVYITDQNHTYR